MSEPEPHKTADQARDLPNAVPGDIAIAIVEKWGSMRSFARAIGLPFWTVYSVLALSGLRPIKTLERLAKPLNGISIDRLANILMDANLDSRAKELNKILVGRSVSQWSRESGMSQPTISRTVKNLEQTQIRNVVLISSALQLDLKSFYAHFDRDSVAS